MLIGEEITVLGAGIGGLAAALAMARRGATVEIIEQAAELGDVGAGIQISANGARVLEALGLGAELAVRGMLARAVELVNGDAPEPAEEELLDRPVGHRIDGRSLGCQNVDRLMSPAIAAPFAERITDVRGPQIA